MEPTVTEQKESSLWQERLRALRNIPGVGRLIWEAGPHLVITIAALRLTIALVPLSVLAVARRIIDIVNFKVTGAVHGAEHLWPFLWAEFALAAGGLILSRVLDYFDARLADRFTHSVSLRVIQHASELDLSSFEDPAFYDRLERARVQATDRVIILTAIGSLFQRMISLVSLAGAVIWYSPWLFLLLLFCVLPAFAGEAQFALMGYSVAHKLTPIRRELDYLRTLGSSKDSAKEIKMFALADYLVSRYRQLSGEVLRSNKATMKKRVIWAMLFASLGACGYYGGYAYLVFQALAGHISIGTLTMLTGAIAGANNELQTVFALFSNISEQSLFLSDLLVFLNERPRVVSKRCTSRTRRTIRSAWARSCSIQQAKSSKAEESNSKFLNDCL